MRVFGLIGHPVSHSFSKGFFEKKFDKENIKDCRYDLFDLESIQDVVDLKANQNLRGLNVTVPYKKSILPLLDFISVEAKQIGAVNTIKIMEGKWFGYNTDVIGFEKSLVPLVSPAVKNALILGTGGASLAVRYVLEKLGISTSFVSRDIEKADYSYKDLSEFILNTHQLIINTTPSGMFPDINKMPEIPLQYLTPNHLVYDLIYNPAETLLLKNAAFAGCQIKNGLEMLNIQADESWKIWTAY